VIIDTSAMVAILNEEPEGQDFLQRIEEAGDCRISVVTSFELFMVIERLVGPGGNLRANRIMRAAGFRTEPVTIEQGLLAQEAFLHYGKGRHRAALNFGDCFSYALAKALNEPLLFKGNDFRLTDITPAF
jgi:ribonuclease VapC